MVSTRVQASVLAIVQDIPFQCQQLYQSCMQIEMCPMLAPCLALSPEIWVASTNTSFMDALSPIPASPVFPAVPRSALLEGAVGLKGVLGFSRDCPVSIPCPGVLSKGHLGEYPLSDFPNIGSQACLPADCSGRRLQL